MRCIKILQCTLLIFIMAGCTNANAQMIGLEKAQQIALQDTDGEVIKAKEDLQDFIPNYEISISAEDGKYDYEIDATTGKILKKEIDKAFTSTNRESIATNESAKQSLPNNTPVSPSVTPTITSDEAQNIALNRIGGGSVVGTVLDYEDDYPARYEYEVTIHLGYKQYELKIHADTGEILSFEEDSIYD